MFLVYVHAGNLHSVYRVCLAYMDLCVHDDESEDLHVQDADLKNEPAQTAKSDQKTGVCRGSMYDILLLFCSILSHFR